MLQLLQNLSNGATELVEAPDPIPRPGHVLIDTRVSLISAGTERMLLEFGRAGLVAKARQQPEKVRQVASKIVTDGLLPTLDAVRSKLNQPIPLGYCNVGVVRASGVDDVRQGMRVVSNGPHASVVSVAGNLCVPIPDAVSDDAAAFTVVASIGLQGIRLAAPTLGEAFVVSGVGLIGLLTVQLLRAQGCRVLAIDYDESKLVLARRFGAETFNLGSGEDPVSAGMAFSRGRGVDGVIIAASTGSSEPIAHAARMCRKRGRIILVGVAGLELNRGDFYEKELTFQVSCSYGPGRYDPAYEGGGNDYPFGYVRWTERRNFEAVLDMLASGQLSVDRLMTQRFPFEQAPEAYAHLASDRSALGILMDYPAVEKEPVREVELPARRSFDPSHPIVDFIGAGNYASRVLIPAFRAAGAQLRSIGTTGGIGGAIHGRAAGFAFASTDVDELLAGGSSNVVVIATRHDTHAKFARRALEGGKHVFVEKPLAITIEQVDEVEAAFKDAHGLGPGPQLMVGFNRRFAPLTKKIKELIAPLREPKVMIMTMNAGALPAQHWAQDRETGGGRIIGEACHFIDLMRYLVGAEITSVHARRLGDSEALEVSEDKATIILGFADGSMGTIHYLANGSSRFPKERVEVFAGGRVLQLDNFRKLKGFGWPGFRRMNLWRQDKGQAACVAEFLDAITRGQESPIPAEEVFEVARASIEAAEQIRQQC